MLPGSNAMEVAEKVKETMKEISADFPEGMSYEIPFDMTTYISESIHHVYRTFVEALILVILVVFLWKLTGTNTAHSTSDMAMSALPRPSIALRVASGAGTRSRSIILSTFSTTTVSLEASSYSTESGINGGNAAVLEIGMLPGSNAMEVAENWLAPARAHRRHSRGSGP